MRRALLLLLTLLLAGAMGRSAEIHALTHTPAQPRPGEAVRVTAKVKKGTNLRAVTLLYQVVDPGHYLRRTDPEYEKNWERLPMRREGAIYVAVVPAEIQKNRRLVRYRIEAEEATGEKTIAPGKDDPVPNEAWYTWAGAPAWTGASEPGKTPMLTFPATLMTTLPVLTLLARADEVEHSQWDGGWNKKRLLGTVIAGGRVYDHIAWHNRGQASAFVAGKNKWGFHFTAGERLAAPPSLGRPFAKPWSSITLDACASPWVQGNRGMAGLDEAVSFRAFELAGVPASRTVPVQFRIVSTEVESVPEHQYEGDLQGLYLMVEDPDGDFLKTRGLPDGSIYRMAGNPDLKHQGEGQAAGTAEYEKFIEKVRQNPPVEWWRANLDLPAYYAFRAINLLTGNVDLRENENHYLYHRPDGRWTVLPWDLDMMFIPKSHQSGRVDEDRCLQHAELRREYQNRCRELLDLLTGDASPAGGQFGQIVAEYAAVVHPAGFPLAWPELDMCRWNFHPHTNDKGAFYRNPTPGGADHNWTRTLATADFAGFVRFVTEYGTAARPAEKPWKYDDGDPRGYGYGMLAAEAADAEAPARPTLSADGRLRFKCSAYAGRAPFGAVQWRLGEIPSPTRPGRYEIEESFTSPVQREFAETFTFPAGAVQAGRAYRARVRVGDTSGRWSRWSEALPIGP